MTNKKAIIYKKEGGGIKRLDLNYSDIEYKNDYVVITCDRNIQIIRNFENIICECDDFSDL